MNEQKKKREELDRLRREAAEARKKADELEDLEAELAAELQPESEEEKELRELGEEIERLERDNDRIRDGVERAAGHPDMPPHLAAELRSVALGLWWGAP